MLYYYVIIWIADVVLSSDSRQQHLRSVSCDLSWWLKLIQDVLDVNDFLRFCCHPLLCPFLELKCYSMGNLVMFDESWVQVEFGWQSASACVVLTFNLCMLYTMIGIFAHFFNLMVKHIVSFVAHAFVYLSNI